MVDNVKTGLGIDDLIGDKREAVLKLAERYGAFNVRVFGSLARGEARPDSDIDLLVSFREEASLYDVSGLWQDLLGHNVDLLTDDPHPRRERLMRRVLKDAVAL
jgi:predicted nucleotidyltransferase